MNNEQPKDYAAAERQMDKELKEAYNESSLFVKIVYHLQDYILPALFIAFVGGYLAGMNFGMFW